MTAFTLVEILIVVGVIVILSGLLLRNLNVRGLKAKARDAQRISDLKKIQTALELYFSDNRAYPINTSSWTNASTFLTALTSGAAPYISSLPVDPVNTGNAALTPCSDTLIHRYFYRTTPSGNRYVLAANMEVASSATSSSCNTVPNCSQGVVSQCNCAGACYAVQNP